MRKREALAEIIEALAQEGFAWKRNSDPPAFEGSITIAEQTLRLSIVFPRLDFAVLPRVRLLDRVTELPGHRTHVEDDDAICYSSPGTLVLDMYEPGRHALTVLRLTRRTLGDILSGKAEEDLAIEFPQHWRGSPVHVTLPPDTPQGRAWLVPVSREGGGSAFFLAKAGREADTFDLGPVGTVKGSAFPAYLARTTRPMWLSQGEVLPSDLAAFLAWAGRVDPALPDALTRGVVAADGTACLLVCAPNGCAGVLTVAPSAWRARKGGPSRMTRMLRCHPEQVSVTRISGLPADAVFVMTRNLSGGRGLMGRRIAVVGCGTIGGHLAKFLAQGGAGQGGGRLDLVDDQIYAAANIGRHWLPPRQVGSWKALACAAELSAMFRSSDIRGHAEDAMERLDLLLEADLVVDATGEEPLSVALNEAVVKARGAGPSLLLVWLRGMGAAAQALFVPAVADGRGCLRCLRARAGAWPSPDVMRAEVPLTEAPAACGEAAFLPYGVAAPAVAAGLAAHMAMEWGKGDVRLSFRTMRLDHQATLAVEDRDVPVDPACPACSTA